jgi:hypothetical protein
MLAIMPISAAAAWTAWDSRRSMWPIQRSPSTPPRRPRALRRWVWARLLRFVAAARQAASDRAGHGEGPRPRISGIASGWRQKAAMTMAAGGAASAAMIKTVGQASAINARARSCVRRVHLEHRPQPRRRRRRHSNAPAITRPGQCCLRRIVELLKELACFRDIRKKSPYTRCVIPCSRKLLTVLAKCEVI